VSFDTFPAVRRLFSIAVALCALLALPAAAHGAGFASLMASCSVKTVEDATSLSYRFCDDGVPATGGRTPNPGGVKAIEVPAAYYTPGSPTGAPNNDGTIDGLPPVAGPGSPTPSCDVPGAAPAAPVGTCTIALDVDITMPAGPPPPGGYPVVAMMHGCCSGNKTSWESTKLGGADTDSEKWHYNNAWFATRGYVVVTYTARGFVTAQNQGSTGETQTDSQQYEINDFQSLIAQMADDDAAKRAASQAPLFDIDPQRVIATGGSYGGGFSWLAMSDPVWTSTGGIPLHLAVAAPKYGWTDLVHSLTPTGHHFYDAGLMPATDGTDSGYNLVESKGATAGIPIKTIIAGLYASGTVGANHATFPREVDSAFKCSQTFYPPEAAPPLCGDFLNVVGPRYMRYSSAYYRNDFFTRVANDPAYRIPVFAVGTHTDPLFPPVEHHRMAARLLQVAPGYPIQEYYGDLQHFTNNKRKEWSDVCGSDHHVCTYGDYPGGDLNANPSGLVRTGITTMLNRFVDFYARPAGNPGQAAPVFDVTASLQVCAPNATAGQKVDEAGDTFTAGTYDALTPGSLALAFTGSQTTTSKVPGNPHAANAEPVAKNGAKCPVDKEPAGPGVAVFNSPALPADSTMIGGGVVSAAYALQGGQASGLQLNARLYDVAPDGSATLADRGAYRIAEGSAKGTALYQMHGNGWRFAKGHVIRLELAQDDDPYLKSSDIPSGLTVSDVKLVLPVRETTYGAAPPATSPAEVVAQGTAVDRIAPVATMLAPRFASDVSAGRQFRIAWAGSDIGTGVRSFAVQARRTSGKRPGKWRTVRGLRSTKKTQATFAGRLGETWEFRVRARDGAGNVGRFARGSTIVPTAERPAGARYAGPWSVQTVRAAFGRKVISCATPRRCMLTIRYRGAGAALIGLVGPHGGRARVTLDGKSRVVDFYSAQAFARRAVYVGERKQGPHTLVVTVLGSKNRKSKGNAIVLDGFGLRDRRG
jgi:acetyl esterase/lipase